jgi:toxin-antitoxin system PIN domain toxin
MKSTRYLLDVNALVALADPYHKHHEAMEKWFQSIEVSATTWGICPLTEAGFVRVITNPGYSDPLTIEEAIAYLTRLTVLTRPASGLNYEYWPISDPWVALASPFIGRLFSHQQVTDSYLLGLAVRNNGVLVTFDRGLGYLAGSQYSRNLLLLD